MCLWAQQTTILKWLVFKEISVSYIFAVITASTRITTASSVPFHHCQCWSDCRYQHNSQYQDWCRGIIACIYIMLLLPVLVSECHSQHQHHSIVTYITASSLSPDPQHHHIIASISITASISCHRFKHYCNSICFIAGSGIKVLLPALTFLHQYCQLCFCCWHLSVIADINIKASSLPVNSIVAGVTAALLSQCHCCCHHHYQHQCHDTVVGNSTTASLASLPVSQNCCEYWHSCHFICHNRYHW